MTPESPPAVHCERSKEGGKKQRDRRRPSTRSAWHADSPVGSFSGRLKRANPPGAGRSGSRLPRSEAIGEPRAGAGGDRNQQHGRECAPVPSAWPPGAARGGKTRQRFERAATPTGLERGLTAQRSRGSPAAQPPERGRTDRSTGGWADRRTVDRRRAPASCEAPSTRQGAGSPHTRGRAARR